MRVAILWVVLAAAVFAQPAPPRVAFISYADGRPILQTLASLAPAELRTSTVSPSEWDQWVRKSDRDIRARLAQGDIDSLVNLLLFGSSFTTQPRMTARQIETILNSSADPAASGARLDAITQARLGDLVRAAASPGADERLQFAQSVLKTRGFTLDTDEGRSGAKVLLLHELGRVLKDIDGYARTIREAEQSPVPGAAFAARSGLYRSRGLSSDTSLAPNFAIEQTLLAMRAKGLLPAITRVAIIGPGLDFADKQEGYDFYPQQTVQPFAVMDTLRRFKLVANGLQMTTFDVSPRVNAHIRRLRADALRGRSYVMQLPLDTAEPWRADFLRYWTSFGDQIATTAIPASVPRDAGEVKIRAVAVAPAHAAVMTPVDLNVIFQYLDLPPADRFDLVIGTNVFLYYNEFQQALAMANIERMIHPGGVLLSNNALVDLPASHLRFVGSTTVAYSDKPDSGDTMVWYKWSE